MNRRAVSLMTITAIACTIATASHAADDQKDRIKTAVDHTMAPVIAHNGIRGMAVGIVDGDEHYVFNYGVASTETGKPVTNETLFELGSVSKTLTATLASYSQVRGYLSLSDPTSRFLPSLQNSPFGNVTLLNLGTHTPGGLPLQVPDNISNNEQLMQYFKAWQPAYAAGTHRTYANPSIGTLGLIAAKSMGQDFDGLMQGQLFPTLGMKDTYIKVPAAKMPDYAQGYAKDGAPIRMAPGVLSSEAYGIKTTAADMNRFVEANMNLIRVNEKLQHAIANTHIGYFKAGPMTQDLIWEQYPYPVTLESLLSGNSPAMIFNATPVTEIKPPQEPQNNVWINKTGSTNGFGAYIAFIPQKRLGIVILANKNFPIDERVTAAYRILTSLENSEH
jgi:beta-lactamase class C